MVSKTKMSKAKPGKLYVSKRFQHALGAFVAQLIFGLIAIFLPTFSSRMLIVTLLLGLLSFALQYRRGVVRVVNLSGIIILMIGFLISSARILAEAAQASLVYMFGLLFAMYLLFLAANFAFPEKTIWLFKEQFFPTTRLGRGCIAMILAFGPVAAIFGAQFGRSSPRPFAWWLLGFLSFGLTLLITQNAAAQYIVYQNNEKQGQHNKPRQR